MPKSTKQTKLKEIVPVVFGPMFLLSIDPGFTNVGVAFACVFKKVTGCIEVVLDPRITKTRDLNITVEESNIENIDRQVKSMYWHLFPNTDLLRRTLCLFEEQYYNSHSNQSKSYLAHKLGLINQAMYTVASSTYGCICVNLKSSEVKSKLKIKADIEGDTKKKVVALVKELVGEFNESHHVADAISQIHYYVKHSICSDLKHQAKLAGEEDPSKWQIKYRFAKDGEFDTFLEDYNKPSEDPSKEELFGVSTLDHPELLLQ
jgi:hypothetical protein